MRKIIIVDDEHDLRNILINHFTVEKWDCLGASNAGEALELIKTFKPDVIISDISMPKISGLEMLADLEQQKSDIPLIFITGYSDMQKLTEAWNLGAFDLIDKPFKIDKLLHLAEHALLYGVDYLRSARQRRLRLQKSV